jgi:putative transposase
MYSYEDRIRAVKLYVGLGKRIGATIRHLGYPTKNALKAWYREYEHAHDLPLAYARSRPRFSDEQKRVAVEHYLKYDRCIAWTIRELGYPCRSTLTAWIDELHPETRKRVVGKARGVVRSAELKQAAVIELCTRQEGALAFAGLRCITGNTKPIPRLRLSARNWSDKSNRCNATSGNCSLNTTS